MEPRDFTPGNHIPKRSPAWNRRNNAKSVPIPRDTRIRPADHRPAFGRVVWALAILASVVLVAVGASALVQL